MVGFSGSGSSFEMIEVSFKLHDVKENISPKHNNITISKDK